MTNDTTPADTGVARLTSVVLDCADPMPLARFYAAVTGGTVNDGSDDEWAVVTFAPAGADLCFQRVEQYVPPAWPTTDPPQQFHIDFDVDDIEEGERQVLALGATKHDHQPGETFRVYLDPQGHPFCLCF